MEPKDTIKEKANEVIQQVIEAAKGVYEDLGHGWSEAIYQKAMEIALNERSIFYESQKVLPVYYIDPVTKREYCVGSSAPDFVIWVESEKKKIGIVVDLKAVKEFKSEHPRQVQKYIYALEKICNENESIYPEGLVINFGDESSTQIPDEALEFKHGTLQIYKVKKEENVNERIKTVKGEKKRKNEKIEGGIKNVRRRKEVDR